MREIRRVYVAGAYSAPDVVQVLGNMRRGMQLFYEVLKAGFSPFVPWFDYHFSLMGEITLEQYYRYSTDWLLASHAVLVVPEGAEQSKGTQGELKLATEFGIPVFYSLQDLIAYRDWVSEGKVRHLSVEGLGESLRKILGLRTEDMATTSPGTPHKDAPSGRREAEIHEVRPEANQDEKGLAEAPTEPLL